MYEAAFKNIDNTLREDDGCGTELDYIEQTSWVLFLKYLDDFESEKETAALLNGETYTRIIDGEFRWNHLKNFPNASYQLTDYDKAYDMRIDGKTNVEIGAMFLYLDPQIALKDADLKNKCNVGAYRLIKKAEANIKALEKDMFGVGH